MARRRTKKRILITAGPTREYLDPVRYLSNESSGKMGFALASAALERVHAVTLVHGPVTLKAPAGVRTIPVTSAQEMLDACQAAWPACDALVMAAAVADYAPLKLRPHKIKKTDRRLTLELRPTVDILATLAGERAPGQVVMGFALEDRAGRRNAEGKLRRKGLDAIVLNTPAALSAESSQVELLTRVGGWAKFPRMTKDQTARRLILELESLLGGGRG